MTQTSYPDISDLLKAKAKRRRELAALPWEEKVKIIEQMQRLLPKGMWQAKPDLIHNTKTAPPD